jgi:uncharacterized membrane protein
MSLFGLTLSIATLAQPGTIITFNVPGAGTGFQHGTTATSINAAGVIAGYYVDSSGSDHGFIRSRDGVFTVFDAPGAVAGTLPYGINDAGAVTGYCFDATFIAQGFVRSAVGVMTTFDIPVSGGSGTYAFSINAAGAVAGFYFQSGESFSFVRDPGAGYPNFQGVNAIGINNAGAIAGDYIDANSVDHGFLRTAGAPRKATRSGLADQALRRS